MAIMIKVHKRGTDAKKEFRNAIKIATKRLRLTLFVSILLNITAICLIVKNHH